MEMISATIEVTPPGSGTTEHWATITVKSLRSSGTILISQHINFRIRYLSSDSTPFNVVILFEHTNGQAISRTKVDYHGRSTSGAEEATYSLERVQRISLDQAMTVN